ARLLKPREDRSVAVNQGARVVFGRGEVREEARGGSGAVVVGLRGRNERHAFVDERQLDPEVVPLVRSTRGLFEVAELGVRATWIGVDQANGVDDEREATRELRFESIVELLLDARVDAAFALRGVPLLDAGRELVV